MKVIGKIIEIIIVTILVSVILVFLNGTGVLTTLNDAIIKDSLQENTNESEVMTHEDTNELITDKSSDVEASENETSKLETSETEVELSENEIPETEVETPVVEPEPLYNCDVDYRVNVDYSPTRETKLIMEDKLPVYLTFDDGPSINTIKILDVLRDYDIKASFFLIGSNIENNLDMFNEIVVREHYVGNHTYSHPNIEDIYIDNTMVFEDEVERNSELFECYLGYRPILVRAPYASFNMKSDDVEFIKQNEYKMWDWQVDSKDWSSNSIDEIYSNVTNGVIEFETYFEYSDDDPVAMIILFHDSELTATALPSIIEYLIEKGYYFDRYYENEHSVQNFHNDIDL